MENTKLNVFKENHAAYVDKINFQLCDIFQSQGKNPI